MANKWRYGMLPMGDTFMRCAFRVYEREDDSLNRVLVKVEHFAIFEQLVFC